MRMLLVLMFGLAAFGAEAQTAFVKARLVRADMVGLADIDAYFTRTFRIEKVLAGAVPDRVVRDTIFSAQPRLGLDYYLLIDRSSGVSRIVDDSVALAGACIDAGKARTVKAVVEDFKKKHPCTD